MAYLISPNNYKLSFLSNTGQQTVLETKQLLATVQRLLRLSSQRSRKINMIAFSCTGLRRPVLNFARKKARMRGWIWEEDDINKVVIVMGE